MKKGRKKEEKKRKKKKNKLLVKWTKDILTRHEAMKMGTKTGIFCSTKGPCRGLIIDYQRLKKKKKNLEKMMNQLYT